MLPEFAPVTVDGPDRGARACPPRRWSSSSPCPSSRTCSTGWRGWTTSSPSRCPVSRRSHMIFEQGTDLYRARQVVQERISQAAGLPQVSRPPQMLQPQSSTSRTSMISLSSKKLTPLQIGVLARWTIRPRLLAVPGVSNVAIWGQRERQLQVQVDPAEAAGQERHAGAGHRLHGQRAVGLAADLPRGLDAGDRRVHRHAQPAHRHPAQPADHQAGGPRPDHHRRRRTGLTLGDVATVVEDHQPLIGDAVLTGDDGVAGLVPRRRRQAPVREHRRGDRRASNEALDELRPGLTGLDMDASIFRPAAYSDKAVEQPQPVGHRRRRSCSSWPCSCCSSRGGPRSPRWSSWRSSFIVAGARASTLFGTSFNAVIIAGLAIALGARHRRRRQQRRPNRHAACASRPTRRRAARPWPAPTCTPPSRPARSAIWASVIFALALVPLFLINGLSGDSFYPPMAGAALLAVVASLLVGHAR